MASGVSKGSALKTVAELLGIGREKVMAVGDGMNDLPMITYAGLGVAMGNAAPELRAAAGYVSGSVEEDGFAQAVERFVG